MKLRGLQKVKKRKGRLIAWARLGVSGALACPIPTDCDQAFYWNNKIES